MKRIRRATLMALICAATVVSTGSMLSQISGTRGGVPMARRSDFVETLHGVSIPDPYRWLEEQWTPETRSWIGAEMAYSRPLLTNLPSYPRVEKRLESYSTSTQVVGVPTVAAGVDHLDSWERLPGGCRSEA